MNSNSSTRGSSARPVAARWTELHLVTQPAPHAAHPQVPPLSAADQIKAIAQQRQRQQQQDRQQDYEFPQRKPPAYASASAALPPQPHPLQNGRRSFDIATHSARQQLRARAGGNTINTSGAFPAAAAAVGTPAFPDHAAVHGAGRHSLSGWREGDGDREWGQGHSQRLRGGTSCQLPEAVAARLRQLLHLDLSPAPSSQLLPAAAAGSGSVAPGAGRVLSRGPAAASTGNCSCGSDLSTDPTAATVTSSRASSALAGACSGMLGSCASIGEEPSSDGSGGTLSKAVEPLRCGTAGSRTGSASTSGGGSSDEAAPAKPATACEQLPATTTDRAAQPLSAAASKLLPHPQPHAAGASAACVLSAVATCPISETYRLFGRAGDPVLHLRLPGVTPAVLAAAAALSAQSRRWALSRFPCGGGGGGTSAAAAGAGLLRQPTQAQEQVTAGGRQLREQEQQQQQPTLLVATTLADGCEEDGVGGAAGVDVAVMNFTAATLTMDVVEMAAAMAAAGAITATAPPRAAAPPLTLTLARPPAAAFPLKATEEVGHGPDGGVDVSAFHVYASEDGQQVLLLLVVERPPLMPMLLSPRRQQEQQQQQQQPRSVALSIRSGPAGASASASASSALAATAAALVAGSATRSWGGLRRQVAPALLRASDAGTTAPASSFTAALEGTSSGDGRGGGAAGRQPHALPPLDPIDDDPVPSCCRRLPNSSSFTVWAEHAAQGVPAAAAAVAVAAAGKAEAVGDGAAALRASLSGAPPAAATEAAAAAAVGDGAVAKPPAMPVVGAPHTLAADNARKANIGASSCNLHSVPSDLLLSRPVPASALSVDQPPSAGPAQLVALPDCAVAHVHMTVTAPGHVAGTAATTPPAPTAAAKAAEKWEASPTQPGQERSGGGGGPDWAGVWPGGAAAAGASTEADGRLAAGDSSGGGKRASSSAAATAVAVIPWAAFVSGDGLSGAAPYALAVPPASFSPDQSSSSSYRTSTSTSSRTSTSASSATASGAGTGASPSLRSSSSTSPPVSVAQLQCRRRTRGVKGDTAGERGERNQGQLRGIGGGGGGGGGGSGLQPYAFFPAAASLSPSAGPLASEELFPLSMPAHASGLLGSSSAHHGLYGSSSGGRGATRFSTTAVAAAADAAAAAAAETTTGWLLAGAPVSFPYVASPLCPSGPTSASSSSSPSSSPSPVPSRSPSPSRSSPRSAPDERQPPPECDGVPIPGASRCAAALQRDMAPTAAAAPPPPPPLPLKVQHDDELRRTEVTKVWRASMPGAQAGIDDRVHSSTGTFTHGSYPDASGGLAVIPDSTAAGVGLGRLSLDSGSAGTSTSGRAAVSAADAARMARVRAGWRAREQEWSEREAAWRVTESRWWQQAGGGGLWG
ncbi:hypothetical protein HYH02_007039 [Chlamydomonas schloesseri]|uniref:Uncharacterized protein n=1 Tax=Chlamydomonas schloesseri TaxID=2026947 RepID=A0A836B565_9CHLO|nr:hypothetical protein HYH02_007039 [Chlamydomonas schloesseri]|eukprot:KAG2448011.1 hypothetical protein HYH02_007039 [Chlamydomonas schloesseri]